VPRRLLRRKPPPLLPYGVRWCSLSWFFIGTQIFDPQSSLRNVHVEAVGIRRASVLWMPPGARNFACRQEWGRQVAYASQFECRDNRAHRGQAKIRNRLCSIGGFDHEEWGFPPKPKRMRKKTYRRAEAKYSRYDSVLDSGIIELAARLGKKL